MDPRAFRNALGQFATGVTIVTIQDQTGAPIGVTVSSFNSVSLDPPLVLWSLDKSAQSLAAFEASPYFAVHVLGDDQKDLAMQFAKRGTDKFAGLECETGIGNCPLLPGCVARFQCEVKYRYEGGDHVIFVGEVKQYDNFSKRPLLFHAGQFAQARYAYAESPLQTNVDETSGSFGPDFTGYLVTRTHFQLYRPLVQEMQRAGLTEDDYFMLSVLCIKPEISLQEIAAFLAHTGHVPTPEMAKAMAERNLLTVNSEGQDLLLSITEEGRGRYLQVLIADRDIGERALAGFTVDETRLFASFLRRVIANTDSGAPDLWKQLS